MNKLEEIIAQIKILEQELLQELQQKQDEYFYIIKGKRVRFEEETRRYHKFIAYGDSKDFQQRYEQMRRGFADINNKA